MSPRVKTIVFSLTPLALLVLGAEAGLRLFDWARNAGSEARTAWFWCYKQDRLLGFRTEPNKDVVLAGGVNHLDTNSDGFRDREFEPARLAGKRVIFCLGESSTWGTGSTNRDTTWPSQLGRLLSTQDSRVLVLNAGMPGYTMVENLQLLNVRLLKYRPEAIVYMGFRNDVVFYATSLTDQVDLNYYPRRLAPIPYTWFNQLFMRSALVGYFMSRYGSKLNLDEQGVAIPQGGAHITPRGEQMMRNQVALIHALSVRNGIKLFWVDQPIEYARSGDAIALREGRVALSSELRTASIPLLEAHSRYDFKKYPMIDDVHFTDSGNAHLAGILAAQVSRELALPRN